MERCYTIQLASELVTAVMSLAAMTRLISWVLSPKCLSVVESVAAR